MSDQVTLKSLPEMPSKADICEIYIEASGGKVSKSYIINQINIILEAFGKKRSTRIIHKPIFKEVLLVLGVPDGYKDFDN